MPEPQSGHRQAPNLGTGRGAPYVNLAFMAVRAIGPAPTKAKTRIATATPVADASMRFINSKHGVRHHVPFQIAPGNDDGTRNGCWDCGSCRDAEI